MKNNFIVFMTDQQRGDSIFSDSKVKTPNADRFRERAVLFKNSYCTAPHCCPSRASFFSGLYPSQHGVWNNVEVSNTLSRGIFDNVRLFSQDLKDNGYNLYFAGKWHVSAEQGPDQFGFEPIYHNCANYHKYSNENDMREWNLYTQRPQTVDTKKTPKEPARIIREGYEEYTQYGINNSPYKDKEVVQASLDKLDEIKGTKNPFFMYVGAVGTHDPYFCPQKFLDMYDINEIELPESFDDDMEDKPYLYQRTRSRYDQLTREEQRESIRRYYAFCSYEDYLFGKLIDKMDEQNLWKNTNLLYLSDHGDYVGSHGIWAKGLPCFKEGYHICSMFGGCDVKEPGREIDEFVSITDYSSTFLDIAGIKVDRYTAGRSLKPFLDNENPINWRSVIFTQTNGNEVYGIQRSVKTKEWKYVFNAFDRDELYDLKNDPNEITNLLYQIEDVTKSEYKELIRKMCYLMWRFAYRNKDNCVNSYIMTAFAPYGPGIIFDENGKLLEEYKDDSEY
jgi:choline-sulfatase